MKALSMWQPWASLWLTNHKVHETRPWYCSHRGWLAVHAAKRIPDAKFSPLFEMIVSRAFGKDWRQTLPRGAFIGAVYVTDCYSTQTAINGIIDSEDYIFGDYSPGRYAIKRNQIFQLEPPIQAIGRQRFWYFDNPIFDALPEKL